MSMINSLLLKSFDNFLDFVKNIPLKQKKLTIKIVSFK